MLRNCWNVLQKSIAKTNQKVFRVEKVIKRKVINYMLKGKATIIFLTVGLIKKHSINESKFSRTNIFCRKRKS